MSSLPQSGQFSGCEVRICVLEGGCLDISSPTLSREFESERPGYHRGVFVLRASKSPSLIYTYSFDPRRGQSITKYLAASDCCWSLRFGMLSRGDLYFFNLPNSILQSCADEPPREYLLRIGQSIK